LTIDPGEPGGLGKKIGEQIERSYALLFAADGEMNIKLLPLAE
jgi:hypothetical protein